MGDIYFVVGDDYAGFSVSSNVVTAGKLLERLQHGDVLNSDTQIVFGLGIGEPVRSSLYQALANNGLTNIRDYDHPASCRLTHKNSPENNLVTEPRKLDGGKYEFGLILHDQADRLSDHVTGQHVSAMIQMEAARQAGIAAVELEYRNVNGFEMAIVIEKFTTLFHGYMFPIPVTLEATIEELARFDNHIDLACSVTLSQAGTVVSKVCFEGGVFQRSFLQTLERRQAKRTVATALKQHAQSPQSGQDSLATCHVA